jgi:hypothetical protein
LTKSAGKKKSRKAFKKFNSRHRTASISPRLLDADCASKFAFNFLAVFPALKRKAKEEKLEKSGGSLNTFMRQKSCFKLNR